MNPLTPEERALAETPFSRLPIDCDTRLGKTAAEFKLIRAVELRIDGWTYREIAEKLDMPLTTIQTQVKNRLDSQLSDDINTLRAISHTRLEQYVNTVKSIVQNTTDPELAIKAIRELKSLDESERKLFGMDAPQKIENMPVTITVNGVDLGDV